MPNDPIKTPWMTPFLVQHKRRPTAKQDGIETWIQDEIDCLESIARSEHGDGALVAYKAVLREMKS